MLSPGMIIAGFFAAFGIVLPRVFFLCRNGAAIPLWVIVVFPMENLLRDP